MANKDRQLRDSILAFIALGVALRILFFFFSSNNGGDSFARIATTAIWLRRPSLNLDFSLPDWPPVHFWLMAGFSVLVRNVTLGCRLLSLACGCLSLWVFWCVAREIYDDFPALLSLIVFALYSLHIGYSTTASSEATYLCLALLGLFGFVRFRRTGSIWALGLGGLALTVDAGIRYESWVIIFLLGLLLLVFPDVSGFRSLARLRSLAVFVITAGLWPVFWMIHEWRKVGNPLYFISYNRSLIPEQLGINPSLGRFFYQIALVPLAILLTITPLVVLSALYGLYKGVRDQKGTEFAILIVGFGLIEIQTIASHGSLALARYSITLGTFLALVSGYGIERFAERYLRWSRRTLAGSLSILMAASLCVILVLSVHHWKYTDKFRAVSPLLQFSMHIEEVAKFLRPHLTPADTLVVDNYNSESNIIAAALGLPISDADRTFSASRQSHAGIWNYIDSQHPRYLIFTNKGTLRDYLPLPDNCSTNGIMIHGVKFNCLFQGSKYRVYKISIVD